MSRPVRVVGAAMVLSVAWLWWPSAAWAHATLISATPSDGASLASAPSVVELAFSDEMQPEADVIVTGPDGESVTDGAPEVDGGVVTQNLMPGGRGQYTIAYRATSRDGHPLTGQLSFAVGETAHEAQPAEPAEPSASTGTSGGVAADPPATASRSSPASGPALAARDVWVPAVLFAAAAACFVLSRRGSRGTPGANNTTTSTHES